MSPTIVRSLGSQTNGDHARVSSVFCYRCALQPTDVSMKGAGFVRHVEVMSRYVAHAVCSDVRLTGLRFKRFVGPAATPPPLRDRRRHARETAMTPREGAQCARRSRGP